jgi:hypothetical protein
VTRSLKNIAESEIGGCDLEHVFFKDEVVPPKCLNVVLDSTAERTVVEESSDTAIDLEGWCDEELSLEQVLAFFSLVFLGQGLTSALVCGLNHIIVFLDKGAFRRNILKP